ncbi:hypothetical protein [Knoellia koreensis]|nr:hypothetical protein [Knoellia sp. DB2414S]
MSKPIGCGPLLLLPRPDVSTSATGGRRAVLEPVLPRTTAP